MDFKSFLLWIVIGLLAGFLAGKVMKGRGFGFFGDVVVGIVGALIGGVVFQAVGLAATGFLGNVICAFVGAVVLLWVATLIAKPKN